VDRAKVDFYIHELRQTVTAAGLNYEVWWVYKGEHTRPKYVEAMRRYNLFFRTSIHAHFVALLIAFYRLYETRKDTYNIPSLLKTLRRDNLLPIATLDQLDRIHEKAQPLWVKVNILRNKAFGHRSSAHTIEDAFREAAVTPNELKQLFELTGQLLNHLTLAWSDGAHAFNLGSGDDAIRLLDDLIKFHSRE
jgi:hypothetical protein